MIFITVAHYFFYQRSEYPKDCQDVQSQCSTSNSSGVYIIKPDGFEEPFEVFCNNNVGGGGWTRFRITDEWGQYQVTHIGELESNATGTPFTPCPTNMIYGTCSCKATCEDPNGQSGCNRDCLGTEGCTCPAGFLMQGSDCIRASGCGCFVAEANLVIPDGETYVNDDCTQNCSCNNNQLTCENYRCSTDAVCDVRDGVRKCYCNEGYKGNGETCPRDVFTDCQDVYDAGQRQDGVYTIMPTGWPSSPFNVHCKMENGGGWTVFQRRTDDSTSFYRNWVEYKEGYYLYYSRGKQFSTHDGDNDACGNFNCAQLHRSGWWHYDNYCSSCWSNSYCYNIQYSSSCKSRCTYDNLNGVYNGGNGEMIYSRYYYYYYYYYCNLQFVEMKIRPTS
ncbi:hypothetical protein BSL78_24193 [Apostichopus japonicus]|uniref:Fibrinogen C-terminal domain-containing protein n=1 Tax=Stichopus japonicus TaxID=307972 RepID=A0A2G8JT77_STIJA|nr:hypothetical protein BSL78_24193 [Apostichopus japonicus]